MTLRAPALFIGHGSPMNAIEDSPSVTGWRAIAARFERPRAIVSVSAHWVTDGVRVTSNQRPRTIHDFGKSFPAELFAVQYPAPGDPALAARVATLLTEFGARTDENWGLDHGTWSVLKHMYPDADVPVIQLSLDAKRSSPAEHAAIARALAPLRDEGVLILGSGNIVHNLAMFFRAQGQETPWDQEFDDHIVAAIETNHHDAVLDYASHPTIPRANADWDHFFPLFYALAAQRDGERAHIFNRYFFPGVSMTSIAYGPPS